MNRIRVMLASLAFFLLAFAAMTEILFGMPIVWWLYVLLVALFASVLLRWQPASVQVGRLTGFGVIVAVLATLYLVPWNSRKPFLRDLYSLRSGMTETDVRQVMGRYIEGTGWPGVYGGSPAGTGVVVEVDTGKTHAAVTTPSGELGIQNSLVFRHSNHGDFNSDWGIVNLENGRVTGVAFSMD